MFMLASSFNYGSLKYYHSLVLLGLVLSHRHSTEPSFSEFKFCRMWGVYSAKFNQDIKFPYLDYAFGRSSLIEPNSPNRY